MLLECFLICNLASHGEHLVSSGVKVVYIHTDKYVKSRRRTSMRVWSAHVWMYLRTWLRRRTLHS